MPTKYLNIGQEFSVDPAGRYTTDGEGSGEEFRENILKGIVLSLEKEEMLEITLDDGVEAYGSSFLVEAFAGLVKYGYIRADDLLAKLIFNFEDEDFSFFRDKIIQYISEAAFNSEKYIPSK